MPEAVRQSAVSDAVPEVQTAAELARSAWDYVPLCYGELRLGVGSLVLLSGPEGSGKSTMLVRLLDSVRGDVLLVESEMALGPQLGELLQRCAVRRDTFHCVGRASVDHVHELCARRRVVAVGIDSIQTSGMESADLRHLLAVTPVRLVVAVSQLNRQGEPHGVRALPHECDVHLTVDSMRWRLAKSRYQQVGLEGDVLAREAA